MGRGGVGIGRVLGEAGMGRVADYGAGPSCGWVGRGVSFWDWRLLFSWCGDQKKSTPMA